MKNKDPKILVAAPTSIHKDYIFLEWFIYVSNLSYSNYDIFIVDNSIDSEYHKKLKALGVNIAYVNPNGKENRDYITESQNVIRDHFLKGNYEYLMSIEVDVFPPRNVIEKLLSNNMNIVGVPYFIGLGKGSNIFTSSFKKKKGSYEYITYIPELKEQFELYNGLIVRTFSNGIGCVLVKRFIIEELPFRYEKERNGHSDTFFYEDLHNDLNIINYVDTSMLAHHYNSDWKLIYDNRENSDLVEKGL